MHTHAHTHTHAYAHIHTHTHTHTHSHQKNLALGQASDNVHVMSKVISVFLLCDYFTHREVCPWTRTMKRSHQMMILRCR